MPIYAYRCRDCGHQFDIRQSFSEDSLTVCPTCEGSIRRVIQPIGVVFKGTGFYINDSRNGSKSGEDKDKARTAADASDSSSGDSAGGDKTDKTDKADKADKADKSEGASRKPEGGSTEKVAAEKTGSTKAEPAAAVTKDRTPAAARAASK